MMMMPERDWLGVLELAVPHGKLMPPRPRNVVDVGPVCVFWRQMFALPGSKSAVRTIIFDMNF